MTRLTSTIWVFAAAALLSACTTETAPTVAAAPKPYRVVAVDVSVAANAGVGRLEDADLRNSVVKKVDAELEADAAGVAGGSIPATARVVFTKMQLRDAGGRAFGAMNGFQAQVTIVNRKGQVLRGPEYVDYSDQARNNGMAVNGLPIGLLINLGRNSDDQKTGQDLARLIDGFSTSFTNWLKR